MSLFFPCSKQSFRSALSGQGNLCHRGGFEIQQTPHWQAQGPGPGDPGLTAPPPLGLMDQTPTTSRLAWFASPSASLMWTSWCCGPTWPILKPVLVLRSDRDCYELAHFSSSWDDPHMPSSCPDRNSVIAWVAHTYSCWWCCWVLQHSHIGSMPTYSSQVVQRELRPTPALFTPILALMSTNGF